MDKEQVDCIIDIAGIDITRPFEAEGVGWQYQHCIKVNSLITRLWFKRISGSEETAGECFFIDVQGQCWYPVYNSLTKYIYDKKLYKRYYNRWYRNHVRSPKEREAYTHTKKCAFCGKKFTTTRGNNIYCCYECQTKAERQKVKDNRVWKVSKGICPECGKQFESKGKYRRFCSNSCRIAYWRKHQSYQPKYAHKTRICQECGKVITESRNLKYCSTACAANAVDKKRKAKQIKKAADATAHTLFCQACGQKFTPHKSGQRCCSSTCANRLWNWEHKDKLREYRAKSREKKANAAK